MLTILLCSSLTFGGVSPWSIDPTIDRRASDVRSTPPGLVEIQGGPTKIGVKVKEIAPLIASTNIPRLVGETPQHTQRLGDFFLMVTEVTNEQFERFVLATGSKPPQSWGQAAIAAGAVEHAEAEQQRKLAASEAGELYERAKFSPPKWWAEHWHESEWELPQDENSFPVEYIDFATAVDYSRWAGLRLMTEFEYQRAGRGSGDATFPWGDEDNAQELAGTLENGGSSAFSVGSFPKGATKDGVHDLSGNVWEWTTSPYVAYPGYSPVKVKFDKRRTENCLTTFDANQRVVVGGSYKNTLVAARLTTRRATERWQATDAMGFRCAASTTLGKDAGDTALDLIPSSSLPAFVEYDTERVIAMDRWESEAGSAEVDGYQIITGYEHFLFVPVAQTGAAGIKHFTELSLAEGPMPIGILSFTQAIQDPALEPGTYLVSWRGAGDAQVKQSEEEGEEDAPQDQEPTPDTPTDEEVLWDTSIDSLVFYDMSGQPVLARPARELKYEKMRPGEIRVVRHEPSEEEREAGAAPTQELRLNVPLPGRQSQRGFKLDLRLKLADGSIDENWRRP